MNQPWSCYLDAVVKLTGIDEKELLVDIGHDGSEVIWPEREPPYCYRGFNPNHMAMVLLRYGWAVVSVQIPIAQFGEPEAINWRDEVLGNYRVILLSSSHAVAFDKNEEIIIPKDFDLLFIQIVTPMKEG